MSRHYFTTTVRSGEQLELSCGWDRPLQEFYFRIVRTAGILDGAENTQNVDNAEAPVVFDSLGLNPAPDTVDPIVDVARSYGIELPVEIVRELNEDQATNVGNKVVFHGVGPKGYYRQEQQVFF